MIPRLYAIIDAGILSDRGISHETFAHELREAAVELVQYRDKRGAPQQILQAFAHLRAAFVGTACQLLLNDRPDLAALAHADGVHVGQDDLAPADARLVLGPGKLIGLSTHNDQQVQAAEQSDADYIAIGPVFATGTKVDHDPVIGLEGVRRARELTIKPLVAIGGINRSNARSVIDAGADSVAIISGLLVSGETVAKVTRDFLNILR